MRAPADTDTPTPELCYHCGEPVPRGLDLGIDIDGVRRPMCCPGCRAVAGVIAANGLTRFYRQRTAFNLKPTEPVGADEALQIYDEPELAATFCDTGSDGLVSSRILLGGVSCAACTWLIERSLSGVPGVVSALVNLHQSRLDLRFDPRQVRLSELLARVEALGYRARPFHRHSRREQMEQEHRDQLRRLGVAGLGMMQVGMFAIALHAGDIQGIELQYQGLLRWVSLLVSGFVVLFSARPFFTTAWRHLRQGALVMDLPVALAIGLAWLASAWATLRGTGQVYFDSVVMFTFFLLLGRFLEHRMRQRYSLAWFDAESTLPDAVRRRDGSRWETVPRLSLKAGDTVLVRAGDTVPADAEVVTGASAVREDTFNGEHLPRDVGPGATVFAGTLNVEGALEARVLGSYRDSRLAALQRSVEQAQAIKPRLARLADRVASWFVGAILLLTTATAVVWSQVDPQQALWVSLAVLVISCPCALALATPAALTSAASALRGAGVIVRGENAIESLARATHLLFDKTGTLTEGRLVIADVLSLAGLERDAILGIGAALQHYSSHPVGRGFAGVPATAQFDEVGHRVGAGIEGRWRGARYRMGSEAYCRELAPALPPPPDEALYWVALCREQTPLAWIGLDDRIRDEASAVIGAARAGGLQVELLSGDRNPRVRALAVDLGIDRAQGDLQPHQKMEQVRALQREGAVVAMVGDGLNDAPVLGLADASFAVAGATDLARTQADFVIVGAGLQSVIATWRKARHCRRVIWQNFGWALGYNLCGIPLAAMGYVPPWAAAIGMSASSLLVVLNSLRLNRRSAR